MPIELIAKVLEISVAAVKWSLERVDGVAAQVRGDHPQGVLKS